GWRNPLDFYPGVPNWVESMIVNANTATPPQATQHDGSAKTLLQRSPRGRTIPVWPGWNPQTLTPNPTVAYTQQALDTVIDNAYWHPNTGVFISRQLIQMLVTSNPTPGYVARVASVFDRNRTNASQLREVVRAILLDPEARGDVKTAPTYG